MTDQPLLEVVELRKAFGGVQALKGVSFALHAGQFHALLGENGAGKSTLIKVASGVHPASGGEIRWQGERVTLPNPSAARALGIGVVHQEPSLVQGLSVVENFALRQTPQPTARRWAGIVPWRERTQEVRSRAAELELDVDPDTKVVDLTVAERKRVAILCTLAARPKLLILDEPTAALTATETSRLMRLLGTLKAQGVAILYVTHRLKEIDRLVDEVTVLKDGELQATLPRDHASQQRILELMVGRPMGDLFPTHRSQAGAEAVRVEGFASPGRFHDVSFRVRAGQVVGLVGLDGHGHFAVARALFADPPAAHGTLYLAGRRTRLANPGAAARAGIGFVSEDRQGEGVLSGLSVRENVGLVALRKWARFGAVGRRAEREGVRALIRMLDIKAASSEAQIETLSGGNQQKVLLARWLEGELRALVLLDPTAGVDIGARAEIYRLLHAMAERGVPIVVATSDLSEALGLCDELHIFYRGTIQRTLSRDAFSEERALAAMTGNVEEAA